MIRVAAICRQTTFKYTNIYWILYFSGWKIYNDYTELLNTGWILWAETGSCLHVFQDVIPTDRGFSYLVTTDNFRRSKICMMMEYTCKIHNTVSWMRLIVNEQNRMIVQRELKPDSWSYPHLAHSGSVQLNPLVSVVISYWSQLYIIRLNLWIKYFKSG